MPPQLSTPAIAEVVHTPEPSAIKPVESSNVKVSEAPNVDDSIVAPVIADSVVNKEDQTLDSELNNSIDEDEIIPTKIDLAPINYTQHRNSLDVTAVIGAFDEYINSKGLDIADSAKTDRRAYFDGYRYCFCMQQGSTTLIHYYCKNKQMMTNIPIMIDELNVAQYCVENELYD
ncbi:unnamed protein product [Phytophthora lilii]|uniref:Unnamed protein product n=1 Tax=Phytophthora lilii TaxID=2077276 RepID=A0A9W6XQS5_9STRA|nr:unnamed protein product [Phytophthora lilii]